MASNALHFLCVRSLLIPLLTLAACQAPPSNARSAAPDEGPEARNGPAVIILIGDGMGSTQLDAASRFRHGRENALRIHGIERSAEVASTSLSGLTDSAAAATAMATGVQVANRLVGLNEAGEELANLFEMARAQGMATGLCSTAPVWHATPASFVAHSTDRGNVEEITQQIMSFGPELLLGGGRDAVAPMAEDGAVSPRYPEYRVVSHANALLPTLRAHPQSKILGLFAGSNLPYVRDRGDEVPSLPAMSRAAIEVLSRNPRGFLLVIEGARIDHAGHSNLIQEIIDETLEFDDTVGTIIDWSAGTSNATILVSSDHETGGLDLVGPSGSGEIPPHSWRWGSHTNRRVSLWGQGPGTGSLAGQVVDHRYLYQIAKSRIQGTAFARPPRRILANGHLGDLNKVSQKNQGDTAPTMSDLRFARDDGGLGIGVAGSFSFETGNLVVLVDVDPGQSTGAKSLSDAVGPIDSLLSAMELPADAGWDFAIVSRDGSAPKREQELELGGLRGLRPPWGSSGALGHLPVNISYGEKRRSGAVTPPQDEGFEAYLRLAELGSPNEEPAISAFLVDDSGVVIERLDYRPKN